MTFDDKFQLDNMLKSIDLLEKEIDSVSDRSCAIVCAAFLDDFLERLILSFLTTESSTQDRRLLENNGPLSTFSAKIVLSYRLGLISKKEYENLSLIRKIRNAFAHDIKINSFDDGKIKSYLIDHIPDENLLPPIEIPITLEYKGEPLDLPTELFIQFLLDEKRYSEIADKFPKIRFRELDKNNTRSVFLSIIHILHACLGARLLFALTNQRKSSDEFKDILEIEKYKTDFINNDFSNQMDQLMELKRVSEEQITKIEEMLSSNPPNPDLLKETKNEIIEHLSKINKTIEDLKSNTLSIEQAIQIHTYRLLKYQFLQKYKPENE